jgi:hypothetical protein
MQELLGRPVALDSRASARLRVVADFPLGAA